MKTLYGAALGAALFYASSAQAVPIAAGSEVSISGSDSFTATSITFVTTADLGGTTGSFSVLGTAPPAPICVGCATMTGTVFTSAFSGQLFTITNNGATATLDIGPPINFAFTAGALPSLDVTGDGTLSLTGFDTTSGTYNITTQGPTGTATVTFSATAIGTATPEPASMAILGSALVGFWAAWRRRNQA